MSVSHGFQGQQLPAQLHHFHSSQSGGVLEQVQPVAVITPGLADQSSEASDSNADYNGYCVIVFKKLLIVFLGSKAVLVKLVKEVLKLQENISNLMTKMVVVEGKIDAIPKPIESQEADNQREVDPDFMTEPLKEIEDVKALEQTLLDKDKYYQLVR